MGRFFTSTQIYNPKQLDRDGFKVYFCEKMKKEGYEVCEADCAELSYVLAFFENCKWVTLSSEAYEQGNRTAQADTARIAKMLKTTCINTTVIDSDCAMLDLYNDKGKKADTLVMGRADDYLGDDIPAPAQAVWEQFVSPDSTWEQFMSVVQGDYVFVEDGLSELAPVIGMDSDNILFEYEDADESNEKLCYLSFKKTASKKEKKPTLNSLFQQIWGAELEPLGFKKPKLRLPYYIRVINDEIIHIVGIHDMKSHLVAFGGIATVYRQELCLDKTYRQNEYWLKDIDVLYHKLHISDKPFHQEIESGFYYHEYIESQPLSKAVQDALNETMTWIVPVLDNIKTLKDVADYEERVFKNYISIISLPLNESLAAPYSDAAIKFILDDPLADLEQRYLTSLKIVDEENIRYNRTQEEILRKRKKYEQRYNESCKNLHMFLEDEEMHSQTLEELARRKKANLEMLKSYGIDFEKPQPKKEKKLTINAAFKQVFGELLEPMGFKLVKSKYPYFVRVVNGEILHVITYKTEQAQYPEDKAFNILCGVATIYRRQIDLNAGIKANYNWLRNSIADFYAITLGNEYDNYFRQTISRFNFFSTIESSLINVMKEASILTEKYVLPVINEINTLENCITFFLKYKLPFSTNDYRENINFNDCNPEDEGFLYIQADYIAKRNKLEETLSSPDINEIKRKRAKEIYSFFIESEIRNIALAELQRKKKANVEILKSYGIDFEKTQPKKEKKLTINAAFKKIYGNALIPLGFKWVKTKEPCFIRVINEEIIHIVGIHDMKPNFIVPFGGATTMYRADLMLNKTYRDTANWLPSVKQFWGWTHTNMDEAPDLRIGSKFYYLINSPDSIEDVVSAALRETIRWIMPALDSVQSLQDFLGYYEMCHNTILPFRTLPLKSTDSGNFEADAVIRYLLGNLSLQFEKYSTEIEKRQALSDAFNPNINTPDNIQYLRNRAKARNEAIHLSVISFENDPEVKQQTIAELQRRKKANLEILKSYGIDSEKPQPKKEKKLTLNAAFKQVFGELLEPMGFKLIKSKYPYYLRVVGEGIIQAISFAKKKSLNLDLNRDEEEVEIYVGISLLSNPLINFDKNPTIIDNQVWMISLNELYRRFIVYMDGFNRKHEEYSFFYQKGNIEEVLNALKQSRDELMPFVLEFLEKPKTLEDIYRLGEITSGIRHDTIILLQKIDELIKELKENLTKKIEMLESVHKDNPERLELLKKRAIEGSEKSIEYFGSFKKGGEKYDDYIKTAEETKEKNLKILESLEVI